MAEWHKNGGDLAEMGYMKFQGFKEACWDPVKLSQWLIDNKLEKTPRYDYEFAEQKKVQMNLINLQKKQQQLKERKAI